MEPSLRNLLLRKPLTTGLYVERIPMSEVPETEEEQITWLHNLYKKKVKKKPFKGGGRRSEEKEKVFTNQ